MDFASAFGRTTFRDFLVAIVFDGCGANEEAGATDEVEASVVWRMGSWLDAGVGWTATGLGADIVGEAWEIGSWLDAGIGWTATGADRVGKVGGIGSCDAGVGWTATGADRVGEVRGIGRGTKGDCKTSDSRAGEAERDVGAKGYWSFCSVMEALSGNGRHLNVWEAADGTRLDIIEAELMDALSNSQ